MSIEFTKELVQSRFLVPSKDFAEEIYEFEVRADPLTGKMSYVYQIQYGTMSRERDLSSMIQKSLDRGCPFCPQAIDQATPKFVSELFPQGRLQLGEARVFPNTIPYAPYSALCVPSGQHFIGLLDFTEEILTNALMAGQTYLRRVQECDANAKYSYIGWNYMPFSGGSQLPPHLHVQAAHFPTPQQKELLAASQQYYVTNGTNFWSDLITEEQHLGERYIGNIGDICWLTSFAPRGRVFDVLAIFRYGHSLLDISEQELRHFSLGLERVFKYMNDQNFYSFNLTINSGITGDDSFWTQARIIPRLVFSELDVSDCTYLQLLQDVHFVARCPEDTCQEIRQYFDG